MNEMNEHTPDDASLQVSSEESSDPGLTLAEILSEDYSVEEINASPDNEERDLDPFLRLHSHGFEFSSPFLTPQ